MSTLVSRVTNPPKKGLKLENLPNEVLAVVGEHCTHADMARLLQANRRFRMIVTPVLYDSLAKLGRKRKDPRKSDVWIEDVDIVLSRSVLNGQMNVLLNLLVRKIYLPPAIIHITIAAGQRRALQLFLDHDTSAVKSLMEAHPEPDPLEPYPLVTVASLGRMDILSLLLEYVPYEHPSVPEAVKAADLAGQTVAVSRLLHLLNSWQVISCFDWACGGNRLSLVRKLYNEIPPGQQVASATSNVSTTIENGNHTVLTYLISLGADLDINAARPFQYHYPDGWGNHLHSLALNGLEPWINRPNDLLATYQVLLTSGLHVNDRNINGETILHVLALHGPASLPVPSYPMVREQQENQGKMHAIYMDLLTLILSMPDVDVDIVDRDNSTALRWAILFKERGMEELLLAHGAKRTVGRIDNGFASLFGSLWDDY